MGIIGGVISSLERSLEPSSRRARPAEERKIILIFRLRLLNFHGRLADKVDGRLGDRFKSHLRMDPMKEIMRIKVDSQAIAGGLLEMVPSIGSEYQNALKFGMLPYPLMSILSKVLSEKFDEIASEHYSMIDSIESDGLPEEMVATMRRDLVLTKKKWISDTEKAVSLEMYKQAEMVV